MKTQLDTEAVIADLVAAVCGEDATARTKHVYREALRGLVRLAKNEQMLEMKANVGKLTGAAIARAARRQTKSILAERFVAPRQQHLEFNRR